MGESGSTFCATLPRTSEGSSAAALQGHEDHVALLSLGRFDDPLVGRSGLGDKPLEPDAGSVRGASGLRQVLLSLLAGSRLELPEGSHADRPADAVRLDHRERVVGGDLCAYPLGERDPDLDRPARQRRAIGRDQQMLEHDRSPFSVSSRSGRGHAAVGTSRSSVAPRMTVELRRIKVYSVECTALTAATTMPLNITARPTFCIICGSCSGSPRAL